MWVYLADIGRRRVKIGCTKDVDARMKALTKTYGRRARLVAKIEGSYHVEAFVHLKFERLHIEGEVFHASADIEDFFRSPDFTGLEKVNNYRSSISTRNNRKIGVEPPPRVKGPLRKRLLSFPEHIDDIVQDVAAGLGVPVTSMYRIMISDWLKQAGRIDG